MRKVLGHILLAVLLGTCLLAQNQAPASTANSSATTADKQVTDQSFSQRFPRYELRPGDVLDVLFEYTPEFNQTVTVQPDGFIALRDVPEMNVQGKTVPQLSDEVRAAYGKILTRPLISVVLKDFEKPYFIATGQVRNPGKYDLRGDTTVIEAVAMAGGFLPSSKHSQVVLFRRVSDNWMQSYVLNVKKMEHSRNLKEDLHLHPGDMVFVPKNRISKLAQFIPNENMSLISRY